MTSYENILQTIKEWPSSERLSLVQDILDTVSAELQESEPKASGIKHPTLPEALGLLVTHQPAPSDQDIQEWLDSHRLEKYG